jgi:hypothetical protein
MVSHYSNWITASTGKSWADNSRCIHVLAFPCFRCGRLSRWCIELFGVLQGFPRELNSLLAEFMSGSMICLAV